MAVIFTIIGIIIGIWIYSATDSFFLGLLGMFVPCGILLGLLSLIKKSDIKEENEKIEIQNNNIEKGKEIIHDKFHDILQSAPNSKNDYSIVTVKDTTLRLYLGKFKIWNDRDKITLLAFEDNELREAIGKGKINSNKQLKYSFEKEKISLFERENTEQILTNVQGGGSKFSIWTGNEKVGRIYTTQNTVGNKCTLLYIENNPTDTKIMFDYEDYSVLKRIIEK